MAKQHKQLGGNSHQRSIASTEDKTASTSSVQPHVVRQEKMRVQEPTEKPRIWAGVFSIPVISALALALITAGGVGVLSMNPPEVKLAYLCFSIGYSVLLSRIIWWAA